MKVPINSIVIRERVRREIGDLTTLMESMKQHGQLNPITITRSNELIAGHRRLLAARKLSWPYIDATIVDRDTEVEKLELELEENVHRKDFSPEELLAGYRKLEKLRRPNLSKRIGGFFKTIFGRLFKRRKKGEDPRPALGTTSDISAIDEPQPPRPEQTTAPSPPEEPGQYGV